MASKTQPHGTRKDVDDFINRQPSHIHEDCLTLVALFEKITKHAPIMWGTSIIGFGQYDYVYSTGSEGTWPRAAFSPRAKNISIYCMDGFDSHKDDLDDLGKYSTAKACLYIKTLSDVDIQVLTKILKRSYSNMKKMYPEKK